MNLETYVDHGGDRTDLMPKFLEWEGHYTHVGAGEALHLNSRHKILPITLFLFPPILWLKKVAKICNNIEKLGEFKNIKRGKFQNICQKISQKKGTNLSQKKKTGDLGLLRCSSVRSGNECGWMKKVKKKLTM